jgi:hypothetical protein
MNDEKRQGPDLSPGPDQHHDLQGPAEDQDDPTRNPAVAQADLTDEHLAKLEAVGVKAEVAKAHAYSITDVGQLPDEFEFYGERAVPSIAFVWRSPSGQESTQLRPDTPVTVKGQERKYLFAKGAGSAVGVVRHESESEVVHFVEGMKQALAVCSWLPEGEGSIYAVAGCRNWSRDGSRSTTWPWSTAGACASGSMPTSVTTPTCSRLVSGSRGPWSWRAPPRSCSCAWRASGRRPVSTTSWARSRRSAGPPTCTVSWTV